MIKKMIFLFHLSNVKMLDIAKFYIGLHYANEGYLIFLDFPIEQMGKLKELIKSNPFVGETELWNQLPEKDGKQKIDMLCLLPDRKYIRTIAFWFIENPSRPILVNRPAEIANTVYMVRDAVPGMPSINFPKNVEISISKAFPEDECFKFVDSYY